ncbi:CHASE2 superfamily protein [Psychroflexus torquis ATCC 700755]|uniref:CHASE2 superfamily protein n=1 Tax=Psychroflexus torquis (strain ATCC 700755 / CIP 106069 / ACAM 623) TaxID=313595 RepID=K4ICP6_PSYTT|nr:CHASE2 domain-containing protein [Psychroflexus torquis]AFU68184.1 CHASE2 superfamily protein [Psychroflexus torquis ATCC 700755]
MPKKGIGKIWLDALYCTIFSIIVSGILYFILINATVLNPFTKAFKDFSFTDVYYSKLFHEPKGVNDIIIINIKQSDRLTIALAIDKVSKQKPKAIGLDILFKEKKNSYIDSILKRTLQKNRNIITPYFFDKDTIIKNHDYFNNGDEKLGYININLKKQDGVIRDFVGVRKMPNVAYSFSTQIALTSGYIKNENTLKRLEDELPINYIGNENSFLTYDIEEILENKPIPAIKDAIVLFGYLGTPTANIYDVEDKHFTPLNTKIAGRSLPDMYGIVIHANIVKMLTEDNFVKKIPSFITYSIAIACCFLGIFLGLKIFKRSPLLFDLLIKIIQLVVSIVLLYITLLLLKFNIYIYITPILVLTLFGLEMIIFYIHMLTYIKKRFKWESHLLN